MDKAFSCDVKKISDLNDSTAYWRRLSITAGAEYWFTIEVEDEYVLYNRQIDNTVGNSLFVSFNDSIETVERCDY